MEARWYNVNVDARVWAGHTENQKQGWLRAPAAVFAIREYGNAYQFLLENVRVDAGGSIDLKVDDAYPQYWIQKSDVTLVPYELDVPAPDPEQEECEWCVTAPSDEEIGRVVRFLLGT